MTGVVDAMDRRRHAGVWLRNVVHSKKVTKRGWEFFESCRVSSSS